MPGLSSRPVLQRKALRARALPSQVASCISRPRSDLLKKAGVECEVPDSGCCGMAGSFGYEADHYQVGLACGERVLLPAVRQAADGRVDRHGRLQLPRDDPAGDRPPRASISRKCCRWRSRRGRRGPPARFPSAHTQRSSAPQPYQPVLWQQEPFSRREYSGRRAGTAPEDGYRAHQPR